MGIYLNPGFENFRRTLASGMYVDKTMMISVINSFIDRGDKYICVSRPRRFGKTIASNMLSSYYSKGINSRELFSGLKIASDPSFVDKLNKYNVIKLDMNSEYHNTEDKENLIKIITEDIKSEMRQCFPDIDIRMDDTLAECILTIYSKTGETFIIIIDEYDALVWEQTEKVLLDKYLSFLSGLFKSDTLRPAISLAYLTGILPVVRDKSQTRLNNICEYSVLSGGKLSEYFGFTSEEVKMLCMENNVNYDTCRKWYDGYRLNDFEIYNPESIIRCMEDGEFDYYWCKTSSYLAIAERIRMNFEGTREAVVRMLSGEDIDVNVTSYLNTMDRFVTTDDIFTYLIHLGYLAYDEDEKTCRIPNGEIRQEWFNAIEAEDEYKETNRIIKASKELLKSTLAGDESVVAEALDASHIHVTSNRSYNNEDALQSAIYLAYIYALNDYFCFKEMTAGKGFADVVYIPLHAERRDKPALIIELKRNDSAESGLDQIRQKKYFDSLRQFEGELLLIGINYDEKEKTHTAKIERLEK